MDGAPLDREWHEELRGALRDIRDCRSVRRLCSPCRPRTGCCTPSFSPPITRSACRSPSGARGLSTLSAVGKAYLSALPLAGAGRAARPAFLRGR